MRRRRLIPVLLLIVLGVAGYFLWPRSRGSSRGIEASGIIEATQVDVAPKIAGRIVRIVVQDGDRVTAGQTVAQLDTAELDAQVAQARAAVSAAQARQGQAEAAFALTKAQYEAGLAQARAAVTTAQTRVPQAEEATRLQAVTVQTQITQARAQIQFAQAALTANAANVRAAEATLQAAEAALARAESDLSRLESLYRDGAISAQQFDAARTARQAAAAQRDAARAQRDAARDQRQALQASLRQAQAALTAAQEGQRQVAIREQEQIASRAQVSQAQAGLESARASAALIAQRAQDVQAAQAAVSQAKAQLDLAVVTRGHAVLNAPISGIVISRAAEVGDLLVPGAPLLTIADLDRPYLRVFVSETDLGAVALGQPVEVRIDALPGRVFVGRVSEINNRAEFTPGNVQTKEERVKLVFRVKVALTNPEGALKPGLPADALILTNSTAAH